jgi:hypothetical protein
LSFREFFESIEHPDLRVVAGHWAEARKQKLIPAWSDLDPSAMARQLGIIWSWTYDPTSEEFTGRLAGERIEAVFGKSFRRKRMSEIFPPHQYRAIYGRHRRVVEEPCLCWGIGRVFIHLDRYGSGERIIMPLGSDGLRADGVLGATIYESFGKAEAGDAEYNERVVFFSL